MRIKLLLLTFCFMLFFSVCSADSWSDIQHNIGEDKVAHFGCSFALNHVCKQCFGMNRFWSAFTTLVLVQQKKKFIDDHWDSGDMIANTAGVLVY